MSRAGNGITDTTFEFLTGLAANNDKAWFDEHRDTWHSHVREPFATFLEDLSMRLAGTELPLIGSAQTMFRINRDVRFSNDKRPYSESVSGLLTPAGTKNEGGRLLYLELGADGGRIGGGMHRPNATALKPIRRRILDEADEFDGVLAALDDADMGIDRSDQVATMPRGFADASQHRHAEVVRCTQLLAMRPIPKSAWLDDTAVERAAGAAGALVELYDFIDRARADDDG